MAPDRARARAWARPLSSALRGGALRNAAVIFPPGAARRTFSGMSKKALAASEYNMHHPERSALMSVADARRRGETMHTGRHFLQIPGPTNTPLPVLAAIAMPTIDH